jgi:hypothetical protein
MEGGTVRQYVIWENGLDSIIVVRLGKGQATESQRRCASFLTLPRFNF